MTKEQRARLATVLEELSALYTDWRIGQIIANVASWARGPTHEAIWDVEDEEFLAAAEAHLARRQAQQTASAPVPRR